MHFVQILKLLSPKISYKKRPLENGTTAFWWWFVRIVSTFELQNKKKVSQFLMMVKVEHKAVAS